MPEAATMPAVPLRMCPRCETPKPADRKHFYPRGKGLDSWCIACRCLMARLRYSRQKRASRVRCSTCKQWTWRAHEVARRES